MVRACHHPTRPALGTIAPVVRAFEELTAQGLLASTVGRGTFVSTTPRADDKPSEIRPSGAPELPWSSLLSRTIQVEPLALLQRFQRGAPPPGAINLTRMQPPPELLPHEQFRRCLDHVMRTQGARALTYGGPREGLPRLREQIAADLRRQGVHVRPDDLSTPAASKLDDCAHGVRSRSASWWSSTYGALNLFAVARADVVGVPATTRARHRCPRSPPRAKATYLIPNCRNPTSVDWRPAPRVSPGRIAKVPLIERLRRRPRARGRPHRPACAPWTDRCLPSTYSKKLIPALRIGYVLCPRALRPAIWQLKHTLDLGTSALLQHALAEFLERGYLTQHLQRVRRAYRHRRDVLAEALHQHLPADIDWRVPDRGVVLGRPATSTAQVYDEALRQGVVVTPGTLHSVLPGERAGLRLTYCTEPIDLLAEGARRLGKALTSTLRRRMAGGQGVTMDGV
jgi:DNA-binding transcriptional MocR family regulator